MGYAPHRWQNTERKVVVFELVRPMPLEPPVLALLSKKYFYHDRRLNRELPKPPDLEFHCQNFLFLNNCLEPRQHDRRY